jgi:hypothetical protein
MFFIEKTIYLSYRNSGPVRYASGKLCGFLGQFIIFLWNRQILLIIPTTLAKKLPGNFSASMKFSGGGKRPPFDNHFSDAILFLTLGNSCLPNQKKQWAGKRFVCQALYIFRESNGAWENES